MHVSSQAHDSDLIVSRYYLCSVINSEVMSIVRNRTHANKAAEALVHDMEDTHLSDTVDQDVAEKEEHASGGGVMTLNLSGSFGRDELIKGVKWNVTDFETGLPPTSRVIVESVKSSAIGSNVGSNLMVSANLFNSGDGDTHYLSSGVTNSVGWTTSEGQDQLVPLGYAPLLSIMPNEYSRVLTEHYRPGTGIDDNLVQRYGHLGTGDSLRANIVPFPGEDYYYVAKDHVVLDIIERNWDALGQDVPGERVRDGQWVKIGSNLVEKVLDELDTKVLKHMPLTDMSKFNFCLKADKNLAQHLDDAHDYPVSVTLTVGYRNVASEK